MIAPNAAPPVATTAIAQAANAAVAIIPVIRLPHQEPSSFSTSFSTGASSIISKVSKEVMLK